MDKSESIKEASASKQFAYLTEVLLDIYLNQVLIGHFSNSLFLTKR